MTGIHGMYLIQGIMSDVILCHEDSRDDKLEALIEAVKVLTAPTFEGECVRVITLDGKVEWDSRESGTLNLVTMKGDVR